MLSPGLSLFLIPETALCKHRTPAFSTIGYLYSSSLPWQLFGPDIIPKAPAISGHASAVLLNFLYKIRLRLELENTYAYC